MKYTIILILVSMSFANNKVDNRRIKMPIINFGAGGNEKIYEFDKQINEANGFFEISAYSSEHSYGQDKYYKNNGGSGGILFGNNSFGIYGEKNKIIPGRITRDLYPIFYHGYSYGLTALVNFSELNESNISPHMKYWVSIFGIINTYLKPELTNFYHPTLSLGIYAKIIVPLIP